MNDEKKWVHPYLEALREQNDWMEGAIRLLQDKKTDPFVIVRAHRRLPDPKDYVTITGIEPTETEKAEIRAELERRTKLIKELDSAIREAMATRWKDCRKRQRAAKKARDYRERHRNAEPLPEGKLLPTVLDTDKGRELLGRAVNAGLLDNAYQPVKGTTNAQLVIITMYVGEALGIRGLCMWETFNRLWHKNCLQNTDWRATERQVSEATLKKAVDLYVDDYGETPVIGWR